MEERMNAVTRAPVSAQAGPRRVIAAPLGLATLVGHRLAPRSFGLVSSRRPTRSRARRVRILYIHVPTAWLAYLAFGVTALGSALYLCRSAPARSRGTASPAPSAEIGVLFTGLTLVAGCALGPPHAGASTGCGTPASPPRRCCSSSTSATSPCGGLGGQPRRSGPSAARIAVLVAVLDVPIVHFSVELVAHPAPGGHASPIGDVKIGGLMLFTLFVGVIAFTLLYVWLWCTASAMLAMEDALDDHGLDLALDERRAEAAGRRRRPSRGGASV